MSRNGFAGINQFKRGAAELDRALAFTHFIGNDDVGRFERHQPLLGRLCAMIVAPASLNGLPPAM